MAARNHQVRQEQAQALQANGRRRRVHDVYGEHIFEAGLAERPVNPFFVTSINIRRRSELYIPMDLVRRTYVDIPRRIVLVDQRQREFRLRHKEWNGGRHLLYVDGWIRFCRANHVVETDVIILEFVPGDDGNSKIRALIIRHDDL